MMQIAEHAGDFDALIVAVVGCRPKGMGSTVRVQVNRYRFVLVQCRHMVVDAVWTDVRCRVDLQAKALRGAGINQAACDLVR